MLIRSGDIRDQSRQLSKWRKILDDFFAVTNFLGAGIVKIVPILLPLLRGASSERSPMKILLLDWKLLSLTR